MMCRCWRSGGLGVGRALMRSGSEKIRGSRCALCAPDLRVGRAELTHRFSQPANNEWHSDLAALCHMPWCVCPQPLFILSSTLSSFFQYILALSLDSSLCCSCLFWCISPHCHSVMLALRDFFTHRYQSSCISYVSGLLCSQYPLPFSSLASAVKTL